MGALAGFLGIIAATEAPQAVFDFLVSSSGALIVFIYMTIAVAQISAAQAPRTRRRTGSRGDACGCFPGLSYAAIAGMGAVLIAMAFTPALQQDFKASCLTLAVAIAAYFVVRRVRRPRHAPYPAT